MPEKQVWKRAEGKYPRSRRFEWKCISGVPGRSTLWQVLKSETSAPPPANKDTPDTARRIIINIVYYVYDIPCHCWSDKLVSIDRISYTNTKFPAPSQQWQSCRNNPTRSNRPCLLYRSRREGSKKSETSCTNPRYAVRQKKLQRGRKDEEKEKKQRRKDRLRPKTPLVRSRNSC